MRILEGVGTLIQLGGLMARLCKMFVSIIVILSPFLLTMSPRRNLKPELFKV